MTDGHTFIDTAGHVLTGRERVLSAWKGFFGTFPDYENVWTDLTMRAETVIATGRSLCASEPELDGPAIWTATIHAGRVSLWRVYEDTPGNRTELGIDARS
jgi:hypothetical protein